MGTDDKGKSVAVSVKEVYVIFISVCQLLRVTYLQFFNFIVGSELSSFISSRSYSAMFVIACGSVVKAAEAFNDLHNCARR